MKKAFSNTHKSKIFLWEGGTNPPPGPFTLMSSHAIDSILLIFIFWAPPCRKARSATALTRHTKSTPESYQKFTFTFQ